MNLFDLIFPGIHEALVYFMKSMLKANVLVSVNGHIYHTLLFSANIGNARGGLMPITIKSSLHEVEIYLLWNYYYLL